MNSLTPTYVQLPSDDTLIQAVHDSYSAIAKSGTNASYANRVAHAFGYTIEQLRSIPAESHMGLSCGNPVAAASIKEGETVLDLGSGGGIDILLASAKIGPRGKAIGLDMSPDMISLARRNALKKGFNPPQVAFVQTALTDSLPITSDSIDCIVSNCVINLLPLSGKANVLKETHRVLKPGGRIVLDDIIAKKPLPENVRNSLAAYVGCISGAIEIDAYKTLLTNAGFREVVFVDTLGDLNVYFMDDSTFPGCCAPKVDTTATQRISGCGAPVSEPPNDSTSLGCCAPKVDITATRTGGCCGTAASKTPNHSTIPGSCTPKGNTTATQSIGGCCGASASKTPNDSTSLGCCTPNVDTTATQRINGAHAAETLVNPFKDFDANSFVASYQIYAIKSSTTTAAADPRTISEPLLRWWDAYPTPTSSPAFMSVDELATLLQDPSQCDEYAVIDVRGNKSGGHIRGSFQYPAQEFFNGLIPFVEKFGSTKQVVFYCNNSNGRAPRCAGWYLDYLNEAGRLSPKVYVLQGGGASWLARFGNEKELADYDQ